MIVMKKLKLFIFAILLVLTVSALSVGCRQADGALISEGDTSNGSLDDVFEGSEIAVFGGGCFWSVEAIFSQVKGTLKVESGYAGGDLQNPTYEKVIKGDTGHAEVVSVLFDPDVVTFEQLLDIYFYIHDPTTLNRQGNDVGEQYRSIILFTDKQQERKAKEFIEYLEKEEIYPDPIVTEVKELDTFYRAEEYHQQYLEKNPSQPYCLFVVSPKVEKFQEKYQDLLK
jgi:peptide-methionine (S)-S-oxide reductase